MKRLSLGLLLGLVWVAVRAETPPATAEITAVITAQVAAWNRGDIDGFMAGYASLADLRFASGGNVTRGWQSTLERYKKSYPDRATMGVLSFTDLEITVLAPDAAIVFGHWALQREKDAPHGLFTLTFKKFPAGLPASGGAKGDQGWRIIQDHTSAAAP
jgi:ketosteroid isomerase-like protein